MLAVRPRPRAARFLFLALILLGLAFLYITITSQAQRKKHVLQPYNAAAPIPSPDQTNVKNFCRHHGFPPLRPSNNPRKVYDLFLLSTELDWLEIRLHTLAPYVDYFVIVESRTTFTGLPKPLHLADNWARFAPFHHQIIARVIQDPGAGIGLRTWDHEDYMRNALFDAVLPELVGTAQEVRVGDALIVSDVDEIPKPAAISLLRHCDFPARLTLRSHFYYYGFQWLHRGEQWPHPQATIYRGAGGSTISPQDLRNGEDRYRWFFLGHLRTWWQKAELWDAAWHCSSCFQTVEEVRRKMESFSHAGWNTPQNRRTEVVCWRVRLGLDLFGRAGEGYERVQGNRDVPAYVLEHGERFGYLLDRDGGRAGFEDGDTGARRKRRDLNASISS